MLVGEPIEACSLADALTREWSDDAHFAAYEPRTGQDDKGQRSVMRLLHEAKDERPAVYDCLDRLDVPSVRMVALTGDCDDPVAHANKTPARAEWRAEQLPKLAASGLAHYETRGGYRVLASIDFEITAPSDAEIWKEYYLGWCEHLEQAHGLVLDRKCNDWTRLYRLPNVMRDGKPQRAKVIGTPPAFDFERHWVDPGTATATAPNTERARNRSDDAKMARAHALADRIEPSVDGHGGDESLYKAACEIASVLGDDAAAIEAVLVETFNGRCLPPWPAAKLAREAKRAAERQATPLARMRRTADAMWAERDERKQAEREAAAFVPAADTATSPGVEVDLSTPIQKLRYLCEGLGIAFDGKCAAIHGYAGSSKGLFLSMIALCVASGTPIFRDKLVRAAPDRETGAWFQKHVRGDGYPVKRVPVVYGDAETGELAEIRIKRLALALGIDLGELQRDGWFRFYRLADSLQDAMPNLTAMCQALDKGEGTMLALDSYSSLVAGDENKSEYADPMWALGRACSAVNAVPVVTMHERKSDRSEGKSKPNPLEGISGTNRLAAALATSIRLTPSDDNDRVVTVACTRAPERKFKPLSLTWLDEGAGLLAVTESKTIRTAAEIAESKAAAKAHAKEQALAERIAKAEKAIVFRLASIERKSDDPIPRHLNPQPSLTKKQLADAAGIHPTKHGPGEAPAVLMTLVAEGWLVADDWGRHTEYRLSYPLQPTEPPWGCGIGPHERMKALHERIAAGRALADKRYR